MQSYYNMQQPKRQLKKKTKKLLTYETKKTINIRKEHYILSYNSYNLHELFIYLEQFNRFATQNPNR